MRIGHILLWARSLPGFCADEPKSAIGTSQAPGVTRKPPGAAMSVDDTATTFGDQATVVQKVDAANPITFVRRRFDTLIAPAEIESSVIRLVPAHLCYAQLW